MAMEGIGFNQFLTAVDLTYQDFISNLHTYLTDNDCKAKIELKSSGYFISYTHIKSKKAVVNLLFRKKGLVARIYGENANKYLEFLNTLPNEMIKSVEKALVCKRLINPNACNPKCSMGYDFIIKGEHFQKCKNNCFMFDVSDKNNTYIKLFIENEIRERLAL